MSNNTNPKNSPAFFLQAAVSFGLALMTMLIAVYYLPALPWIKAFLALGTLFLTTSSFTLAKCIRDQQEDNNVVSRLDQARMESVLVKHDPYKSA